MVTALHRPQPCAQTSSPEPLRLATGLGIWPAAARSTLGSLSALSVGEPPFHTRLFGSTPFKRTTLQEGDGPGRRARLCLAGMWFVRVEASRLWLRISSGWGEAGGNLGALCAFVPVPVTSLPSSLCGFSREIKERRQEKNPLLALRARGF